MKKILSFLLAAVMFVSLFATVASADPATLQEKIDEKYEELVCIAHGLLDIVCGTSGGTICPDDPSTMAPGTRGLELAISEIFGYPCVIEDDELLWVRGDYGGLGDGQTAWPGEITVTFTDPATGETYEKDDVDLALYKAVGGKYCGAIDDHGFLGCCPDDWPDEARNAKLSIDYNKNVNNPDFWNEDDVFEIPGDEYTVAAIEAWYRDVTKLGDGWDFYITGFNADEAYTGNHVQIGLMNRNINDEGRTVVIACGPVLKIHLDPLNEIIDDKYEDLVCIAHSKLDLVFGTSGTLNRLADVIADIFGYPCEISDEDLADVKSGYGGLGNGQTAWVDCVYVTFSNPATGETYEKEMDLALFKSPCGEWSGAINADHPCALGICPDDWPDDARAATKLNDWDEVEFEINAKAYTPETIEAWARGELGLGDDWAFFYEDYDAGKAYTGDEIFIAFRNDNVNGEGRTMVIAGNPILHIPEGAPLSEAIDDTYEDLVCIAHSKLDLVFGTSGSITTESLAALMTQLFEFPATVEQEEIDAIKDVYGGLGGDQYAWVDSVYVIFTNPATGITYEKEMDLSIYKSLNGQYSGALNEDHPGYFGICPEDWSGEISSAAKLININDETVVELTGEAYDAALLEAWYREQANLGEGWTFFCDGLDEEKATGDGNEVCLALMNNNVNDEGRTMIISSNPTVKFTKTEPVPTINFTDVAEGEYYYDAVAWAVANKITAGTSATTFSPNDGCTRGQVVTFLWRSAGEPEPTSSTNPFKDVKADDYFYKAVLWAVEQGITLGTDKTHFSPNDTCTRGQIVTFLYRWQKSPKPASSNNPFKDVKADDYFLNPVLWAVEKGITLGTDSTHFSPEDTCTRAQVVTFMFRGK